MAQWLTVTAMVLLVVNGAVLALDAHSYGWAAALFATAAGVGVATGTLGRPLRRG